MNDEYIYLKEKTLRRYIAQNERKLYGKEYEFGAAIILKNFYQLEKGLDCVIGFKINPKYRNLYVNRIESISDEEVKTLLEKHTLENDPVDIGISPSIKLANNRSIVWPFQLKRFGHYQNEKDTKGLIKFFSKIRDKYSKSSIVLAIFFDGHKGIDLEEVWNKIKLQDFPFKRIMFINTDKNPDGIWKFHIGELWPNYGYNEYDINDLVKTVVSL